MHNNPLVTVVCLCYNHSRFIVEALDSVLNQTYPNIELIIVDDCSTDNSVLVIEEWRKQHPEVPFLANTENLGNTKSFNQALRLAKGGYIIDLAADDYLVENCVELQLHKFKTSLYPNLGIVYGNVELVDENDGHIGYFFGVDEDKRRVTPQPTGNIYMGLLNLENNVCSVSSMVKKELYDRFNGYNENLAYEDYDFWLKASRHYNFDFIDTILVKKRELRNSLSAQRFKKLNKKTRRYNFSSYQILLNALKLNQSKAENKAILKRIHYEMWVCLKTIDPLLLIKYIFLEMKIRVMLLK